MVKRSSSLMNQAVKRIVNIVQQLSLFATKKKIQLTLMPLGQLLNNSINRFSLENDLKAKIKISNADPEAKINANAEVFENILGLLLMNAWESYPEGYSKNRKIEVQTKILHRKGGKHLQVKVSDNRKSVDSKLADHVFEPFITSKTSVGRGMGLTIARHSIRSLGGDITL